MLNNEVCSSAQEKENVYLLLLIKTILIELLISTVLELGQLYTK